MKIAIPHWEGRVSTVFDFAKELLLLDFREEEELSRKFLALEENGAAGRFRALRDEQVNLLICGVISLPLARLILSAEIELVANVCGSVEDVIEAWLTGRLNEQAFRIPKACRRSCGEGGHRRRGPGKRGNRRCRGPRG